MSEAIPDIGVTLTAETMPSSRRRRVAIGQGVRLTARFADRATGLLAAVTDPSITVQPPALEGGALPAPLAFPADQLTAAGTGTGTGVWRVDVLGDKAGAWRARAECTAPRAAAVEIEFDVAASNVAPPPAAAPMLVTDDLGPIVIQNGGVLTAQRVNRLPRSGALTGGETLLVIRGEAALLATPAEVAVPYICDIREFDVSPDHDSTAGLQQAMDQAATAGAVLRSYAATLPISAPLVFRSGLVWEGGGLSIQLQPGSNCDVLQGEGAYELFGSGSYGGIHDVTIRDLFLDGDMENQAPDDPDRCNGLALYGYKIVLENVRGRRIRGHGLRTEWGQWGEPLNGMESAFRSVNIDTCGRHAWWNKGPHDINTSQLLMVDASQEADATYCGLLAEGYASGRHYDLHGWHRDATSSRVRWQVDSAGYHHFTALYAEGGRGQYRSRGNDKLLGPQFFYQPGTPAGSPLVVVTGADLQMAQPDFNGGFPDLHAIQIGHATEGAAYGYRIGDAIWNGFVGRGPLNFVNDGGFGKIEGRGWGGWNGVLAGTPHATTKLYIEDNNGGARIVRGYASTPPGPYADNTAAAAAGVLIGEAYRRTSDNLVVVRAA